MLGFCKAIVQIWELEGEVMGSMFRCHLERVILSVGSQFISSAFHCFHLNVS